MRLRRDLAERLTVAQDEPHIRAARALLTGTASEFQQKLMVAWLLDSACRVGETSFWPGDPSASAFLEGRRSIAADFVSLTKAKIKEEQPRNG